MKNSTATAQVLSFSTKKVANLSNAQKSRDAHKTSLRTTITTVWN